MNSKRPYAFQKFKLEIRKTIKICDAVYRGIEEDIEICQIIGINKPKLDTMWRWATHLGLINKDNHKKSTTELYDFLKKNKVFEYDELLTYEILYIELIHSNALFDLFVNEIAPTYHRNNIQYITKEGLYEQLSRLAYNYPELQTTVDELNKGVKRILADLTNMEGFGPLRILEITKRDLYRINSHEPLLGVFLYALYRMLKTNQIALKIGDIATGRFSPGSMFMLDRDKIMNYLYKLEKHNVLQVQTRAGLDQIILNFDLLKHSLLERVIELE